MKVLLTGAFGNIGFSALQELLQQGHTVRCFDKRGRQAEKKALQVEGRAEVIWGDLRCSDEVAMAVQDQEVIVHLGYIIPPQIEEDLEAARQVNMDGTRYILEAAQQQSQPPKILFGSSLDVFGFTQNHPPPRKVTDPVQVTDEYTKHKLYCEARVRNSSLVWSIYRFADVPPLAPRRPHPIMYKIPLDTRFEMLHTYDAGLAIANGISCPEIWGKVLLVGGGSTCQVYYRDYLGRILDAMGIGMLPVSAFGHDPYCTDWLDTEESERLLHYQHHSFDEIIQDVAKYAAPPALVKLLMPLIRPLVRRWILRLSPYIAK
ncbi:MAG: NAD(P)-dependent oxidoreductase [Ktedonobacteraceae bacterium]|nr:NAD(P)-dependent oxidoreductase [Ktedonobacteraceae bacterium]